ncbi:MAG: carbamoyltransferase HypF, partial [Pirellulales bacterium]|nr:carbamoyltransferase HypF [Pirellulales bacterium]
VHNREIVRPVDDSVVQYDGHASQILRRARGYAPLPIEIATTEKDDAKFSGKTVLAVGGHLKNTVALKLDGQVVVGAHVGDLDNIESVEVHHRAVEDLLNFFQVVPDVVACDLHPDYASTRHAESLAKRFGAALVHVQHHHAHVASCVAEHGLAQNGLSGPVLGLAWDGTGFGPDKTIWGGEAFLVSPCCPSLSEAKSVVDSESEQDTHALRFAQGRATQDVFKYGLDFTRFAHLRTFGLPGGDHAVRQPRRSALGALFELDQSETERFASRWFEPEQLQPLMTMMQGGTHCPRTSSMGRLFDAVAAFCNLPTENDGHTRAEISFEGQAAMALQFAAHEDHTQSYEFPLSGEQPMIADWGPAVRRVLNDLAAGLPAGIISSRFHHGLADLALQIAQRAGCSQVVLSGGCFQNMFLSRLVRERLSRAGFNVYTHRKVPPGDGGIALGQAFIAAGRQCRSEMNNEQ